MSGQWTSTWTEDTGIACTWARKRSWSIMSNRIASSIGCECFWAQTLWNRWEIKRKMICFTFGNLCRWEGYWSEAWRRWSSASPGLFWDDEQIPYISSHLNSFPIKSQNFARKIIYVRNTINNSNWNIPFSLLAY